MRKLPPGYKSSPQPVTIYSGPSVPIAYDPNWQFFTNLTPAQIAWFQAQPEWQNFLQYFALSPTTATAGVPVAVVNTALQAANIPLVPQPVSVLKI
jgi:hypothetical protein